MAKEAACGRGHVRVWEHDGHVGGNWRREGGVRSAVHVPGRQAHAHASQTTMHPVKCVLPPESYMTPIWCGMAHVPRGARAAGAGVPCTYG